MSPNASCDLPAPSNARRDAWAIYADRSRSFETAFWLHQIAGIAGAHRFYLGRRGSALAMCLMSVGSALAAALLYRTWGSGVAVFALPVLIAGIWDWLDSYDLRDMVRKHNRALAARLGIDPQDADWWDRSRHEIGR